MPAPRLISVRTDLVLQTMVESMAAAVADRWEEPLAAAIEAAVGPDAAARAGYLARDVELERFQPARRPLQWLAEPMGRALADGRDWSAAAAEVAAGLERREPGGRPAAHDDGLASWRVPGPGGHVRHYMALATAERFAPGMPVEPWKRSWLRGFFVHCCAEAAPPPAAG